MIKKLYFSCGLVYHYQKRITKELTTMNKQRTIFGIFACILMLSSLPSRAESDTPFCRDSVWKMAILEDLDAISNPNHICWENRRYAQRLIHLAAQYASPEIFQQLLDKGARIDAPDENGSTPLMVASEYGNTGVVKILLDEGAEVNAHNKNGWTALMVASYYGKADAVEILLYGGSEVDAQNEAGWTPLTLASHKRNADVVKILLTYGASKHISNSDGKNACDLALSNSIEELLDC